MVEHNDRSSDGQSTNNGLSIDDVSTGMLLDVDGVTYRVVNSPHRRGLSMARTTKAGIGEHIDLESAHASDIFDTTEVKELRTYNPETHASVPRTVLATAADELDTLPPTDAIKQARDVIWDKLGYTDDM